MQDEIRFATFNALNLALPETRFYENHEPYSIARYDAKITWLAQQMDRLDADVIGFQEIFSQAALADVLARTRNYRSAQQIGVDPEPRDGVLTPSVALVTRLPVVTPPIFHAALPRNLSVTLPGLPLPMTAFTRPVLQAELALPRRGTLHAFVTHLKSKRPDTHVTDRDANPNMLGIGTLRSLLRRGTEALGLRYLLSDLLLAERVAVVVLGDFNDGAQSVSTQLVMGSDWDGGELSEERLFDCFRIQSRPVVPGAANFTHLHDGRLETIDHVLVSAGFHPQARQAIGEVLEVQYLNDHVAMRPEAASDHGQVLVRVRLLDPDRQVNNAEAN